MMTQPTRRPRSCIVQRNISRQEVALQLQGKETRAPNNMGTTGTNPTISEIETLIAKIEFGSNKSAARALGISLSTVKNHITSVMIRIGASHVTHAVVLMWPVLKDYWPEEYHPVTQVDSRSVWHPGDPDRRINQRRRHTPPQARATYNPAELSYVQGYVKHIGDLCVPVPVSVRKA